MHITIAFVSLTIATAGCGSPKMGNDSGKEPAGTAMPSKGELVQPGQAVPNIRMLDENGDRFDFDVYKGKATIVTFCGPGCPAPSVIDRRFETLQQALVQKNQWPNVRLVSVSLGPSSAPPILKEHAQKIGADRRAWDFVMGDEIEIRQWAARFGVPLPSAINDCLEGDLRTAIIDRRGNLVSTYTGTQWTPAQLLDEVR